MCVVLPHQRPIDECGSNKFFSVKPYDLNAKLRKRKTNESPKQKQTNTFPLNIRVIDN